MKKVIAQKNFKANGVEGYPGKVLSEEEVSKIESVYEEMMFEQLISFEEEQDGLPEVPPSDSSPSGEQLPGEGIQDGGPDEGSDLESSPEPDAVAPQSGKKNKKRG